jgi:hypothetical protein
MEKIFRAELGLQDNRTVALNLVSRAVVRNGKPLYSPNTSPTASTEIFSRVLEAWMCVWVWVEEATGES